MKFLPVILLLLQPLSGLQSQNQLPAPSGPLKTGTRVFNLLDNSRYDSLQNSARNIIVQAWYPVDKKALGQAASYIEEKPLIDYMVKTNYYYQDSLTISKFYALKTNSYRNAPLHKQKEKYPVVFFSQGLGVARANYTILCEELASHGIIVLFVDHLYAGTTLLPNTKIAESGQEEDPIKVIRECINDLSFILNQLKKKGTTLSDFMGNQVDVSKIGAMGHSQGGNVAMESTLADKRIKFSINLDGGFFDSMGDRHVDAPCLIVRQQPDYSDEDLKKKGRTREGWEEMGRKGDETFDKSVQGSSWPVYNLKILGTGHFSFSDAPFVMPDLITRFGGKIIDPERSLRIQSTAIRLFIAISSEKTYSQEFITKMKSFKEVFYLKTY